jgi:hypothetical protein
VRGWSAEGSSRGAGGKQLTEGAAPVFKFSLFFFFFVYIT